MNVDFEDIFRKVNNINKKINIYIYLKGGILYSKFES